MTQLKSKLVETKIQLNDNKNNEETSGKISKPAIHMTSSKQSASYVVHNHKQLEQNTLQNDSINPYYEICEIKPDTSLKMPQLRTYR